MRPLAQPERDRLIDAYLDGRMSEPEGEEFARRFGVDTELRAVLAQQERIDAALRRRFAPPLTGDITAWVESFPRRPTARDPLRLKEWSHWRWPALAAALVLAVGAIWLVRERVSRPVQPDLYAWRSFEKVYRDEVAGGFKPRWVCKDDREFASSVWGSFGQPLLMRPAPGIEAVGWSYSNSVSSKTMQFLARVGEARVLVFVDLAARGGVQTATPRSGLHVYERVIGRLVLYELTPLDRPHVLELFYEPQVSEAWLRGQEGETPVP